MQKSAEQTAAGMVTGSKACLQPVEEGNEFIDFGDDAVLFGEWREGEQCTV